MKIILSCFLICYFVSLYLRKQSRDYIKQQEVEGKKICNCGHSFKDHMSMSVNSVSYDSACYHFMFPINHCSCTEFKQSNLDYLEKCFESNNCWK